MSGCLEATFRRSETPDGSGDSPAAFAGSPKLVNRVSERCRKRTWKQLFRSHRETLYARGSFAESLGAFSTIRQPAFFVIELRPIQCRARLGGLLRHDHRSVA